MPTRPGRYDGRLLEEERRGPVVVESTRSEPDRCDGVMCCLGCLSVFPGVKKQIVDKVAFFPPRPPGYVISAEGTWMLRETDGTYGSLSDHLGSSKLKVSPIRLQTAAGNLICGLHFLQTGPGSSTGRQKTVVFSHGNSADVGYMFSYFKDLCEKCNVNVLAYDYSGYGLSTGLPSERNLYLDIQAVYSYLTEDLLLSPQSLVLYGQSVGSAAAIDLASHVQGQLGGVILHAALKSGLSVLHTNIQKPPWFDVFQNVTKISDVEVPVFLIHGTADQEVGFDHGVALHEACRYAYPPWWVQEGGHNDIEMIWRTSYYTRIKNFLQALDAFHAGERKQFPAGSSNAALRDNKTLTRASTAASSAAASSQNLSNWKASSAEKSESSWWWFW